jgi:NAD(P)H-dependent flavin oxidoreductase YrpB (nitropropane dioxygenase family)
MRRTSFTDLVGCELPIQLAGMGGGISEVGLAAAVTDAGGLGTVGAAGIGAPSLRSMLDALSDATDGPFAVNFLMPFVDIDAVRTAARLSRLCDFHFGAPDAAYVEVVHEEGALAAWQVGSPAEAEAAVEAGCDLVIAQGVEAGGHVRGTTPLDDLLARIVQTVDVPVAAAGGIGTSDRVREVLEGGAAAVRVGTRFLAASECPAHPDYVDALIAASADDTELTMTFGTDWPDAPHRVLRSSIAAAMAAPEGVVATIGEGSDAWPVVRCSSIPPTKDARGNVAAMAHYAGTSVDHVTERQPAAAIVADLCSLL